MNMKRAFLLVALPAVVVGMSACESRARTYADTASGRVDLPGLKVADVTLGRGLSTDKRVITATDNFTVMDTIFASVRTTGVGSGARLTARWMFEDTTMVQEQNETISPTGDAITEFHISKPTAWPKGKYKLILLLNGSEVETESFTVK